MKIKLLAIDLAKSVFQLHGCDEIGRCVLKRKLRRAHLIEFVATLPICRIATEACASSNYWAREFRKIGHEVVLISLQFVKPFVKTNKNDSADAEAIAEAAVRPNMKFVPIKEVWQQELQALHRGRSLMLAQRVAFANALRGLLSEHGYVCRSGEKALHNQVSEILSDEHLFSGAFRDLLIRMQSQIRILQEQINDLDRQIKKIADESEKCQRIQKIQGVGPLSATAILAAVGDPKNFKNGRHFSAWLGLVPKQHSSGGKDRLLGISKRGDSYIRSLLIHGARAALQFAHRRKDKQSCWAVQKAITRGTNKAVVALANRNARIIWALLSNNATYQPAVS